MIRHTLYWREKIHLIIGSEFVQNHEQIKRGELILWISPQAYDRSADVFDLLKEQETHEGREVTFRTEDLTIKAVCEQVDLFAAWRLVERMEKEGLDIYGRVRIGKEHLVKFYRILEVTPRLYFPGNGSAPVQKTLFDFQGVTD